jgi:hypothetical protein
VAAAGPEEGVRVVAADGGRPAEQRRPGAMMRRLNVIALVAAVGLMAARTGERRTFGSPEEARDALIQAAAKGLEELHLLFGSGSAGILRTGDDIEDKNIIESFNRLAAEKTRLQPDEMNPNRATLLVGIVEWPFAVPLNKTGDRWFWDIEEGKAEVRRRTIGANELNAIDICRGYVEAQRAYAETDWDKNGVFEYAKRIVSSEGSRDGLYWPGEDSPVAAPFARAVAEGYKPGDTPKPYHGYLYKVLPRQGSDAPGRTQEYVVKGFMIGGFALVAWPAEYGVSGIMTFLVNHDGVVYEKDLGPQTSTLAKAMTRFNPDRTWRVAPDEPLP